jgi:hypothetical protein
MKLIKEKCGEEFGEENCGEERAALLAIENLFPTLTTSRLCSLFANLAFPISTSTAHL